MLFCSGSLISFLFHFPFSSLISRKKLFSGFSIRFGFVFTCTQRTHTTSAWTISICLCVLRAIPYFFFFGYLSSFLCESLILCFSSRLLRFICKDFLFVTQSVSRTKYKIRSELRLLKMKLQLGNTRSASTGTNNLQIHFYFRIYTVNNVEDVICAHFHFEAIKTQNENNSDQIALSVS